MTKETQPKGEAYFAWALFNWGHPWGTFRTRREAIKYAERGVGKLWKDCRKCFTVVKATVEPWK